VDEAATIGAFALLNLILLPVQLLSVEIIARRQQRAQFWAELWAIAVTYSAGLYLMSHFGVIGAGVALAVTGVGQVAYYAVLVWRLRRA
jgi:O-antigen/teichoic acid export membrane protein